MIMITTTTKTYVKVILNNSYPVRQQNWCGSCAWFRSLNSNITKSHITMVINHTSCDLEEGIHPLIFVTQCPSGVGTEARFVRVNGNGVALVQSWQLIVDIGTQIQLRHKARFFRCFKVKVFGWSRSMLQKYPPQAPSACMLKSSPYNDR